MTRFKNSRTLGRQIRGLNLYGNGLKIPGQGFKVAEKVSISRDQNLWNSRKRLVFSQEEFTFETWPPITYLGITADERWRSRRSRTGNCVEGVSRPCYIRCHLMTQLTACFRRRPFLSSPPNSVSLNLTILASFPELSSPGVVLA